MQQEVWKAVVGYENIYEVSNLGNVRSLHYGKTKMLSLYQNKYGRGYLEVRLQYKRRRITTFVHRLVAQAFISNPESRPFVCHIDDNPANNNVSNLFWGTPLENMLDKIAKGRMSKGEEFNRGVLTNNKVITIRELYAIGYKVSQISKILNTSSSNINGVINGKTWKHA